MIEPQGSAVVPVHPEPVVGEARALRWVVPAGLLPTGRLLRAPGSLGAMLADDTITAGLVEHAAVWLWLRADLRWSESGPHVRRALQQALGDDPAGWVVQPSPDEVATRVSADVLAGPAGDYVRSHGGRVAVAGCADGVLVLELGGACSGCPALEWTLRERLEIALRIRLPDLVSVRCAESARARPVAALSRRERTRSGR